MDLTLEHIDPRNGILISGLCNEFNEVLADKSYNSRKTNRFVPYRICDYPAPVNFGDIGEFLIDGQWVVCEFGGSDWWKESNKIGNGSTKGGRKSQEKFSQIRQKALEKYWEENKTNLANRINSHPNTTSGRFRGGKASGKLNTPAQQKARKETGKANGKKVSSTLWVSIIDGFIGNAGNVSQHNKAKGWDPNARIKLNQD